MRDGDCIRKYATFHVGSNYYGVDVCDVQEVLRHQATTPVPLAAGDVSGLINLRGQIVTAIDLRHRLGVAAGAADDEPFVVVVRTGNGPLSLVVDSIGDVVDVDGETFEAPPPTLRGEAREFVLGVYVLERRLLQVLDLERLVALVTV